MGRKREPGEPDEQAPPTGEAPPLEPSEPPPAPSEPLPEFEYSVAAGREFKLPRAHLHAGEQILAADFDGPTLENYVSLGFIVDRKKLEQK